jgi:hypothetical protein
MANVFFEQQRAVDPFSTYTSAMVNRLTRMVSERQNSILKPTDLEVTIDSTGDSTTIIEIGIGSCFKDNVYIEMTDSENVDISDSDYYESGSAGFGENGIYYLCIEYVFSRSHPAPTARIRVLNPSDHGSYPGDKYVFIKAIKVQDQVVTNLYDADPDNLDNKRLYSLVWQKLEDHENRLTVSEEEIDVLQTDMTQAKEDIIYQSEHNNLTGRSSSDCHPASSIVNDSFVSGSNVKSALDNLNSSLSSVVLLGLVNRPQFTWKDIDEIYISSGLYNHNGTTNRIVYWNSQLTYKFGSGGSNPNSDDMIPDTWFYLYIDDSTLDSTSSELDETNLISLSTPPTFSNSKHGWYNGSDRCIFANYCTDSTEIMEFFHDGNTVYYSSGVECRALAALDDTFTDVIMFIPEITNTAISVFYIVPANDGVHYAYWRTNGSADSGHKIGHAYLHISGDFQTDFASVNTCPVITDSSKIIEVRFDNAGGTNQLGIETDGWLFPCGM